MAIAKIQRMTVVTTKENHEALLKAIQGLQRVEIKEIPLPEASESGSDNEVSVNKSDTQKNVYFTSDLLEQIHLAQKTLAEYVPKKTFKENYRTKTPIYSLRELEASVEMTELQGIIDRVREKRQNIAMSEDLIRQQNEEETFLTKWQKLRILPRDTGDFKHVQVFIGSVPQTADNSLIDLLRQDPSIVVEELFQNNEDFGLVAYTDKPVSDAVRQKLNHSHFQELVYGYSNLPEVELMTIRANVETEKERIQATKTELSGMRPELDYLEMAEEYSYAWLEREKAAAQTVTTNHLLVVDSWVEEEESDRIIAFLAKRIPANALSISVEEIGDDQAIEEIPIKLKNNGLVQPFEMITEMYSLPKYNEIDPTPWLTPFYIIFFGMMMADLGYGLVMWLITLIALKLLNLNPGMKKFMTFGHILSYPTMAWGLIYGSLFGASLPFHLVSPTEDVITVLLISIGLGFIQILLGLFLKTSMVWRESKLAAFKDGLSWVGILIGLLTMVIGNLVLHNSAVATAGAILASVSALAILFLGAVLSDNKLLGAALGLYDLYGITSYIGDLVSYTRLMAIGISGGSIALAFNMLVGFFPPIARFTVGIALIVFLQVFNLGLSLLSAYVHGARLTFVEFFGKFYEGGGRAFQPLKGLEKHITIKEEQE